MSYRAPHQLGIVVARLATRQQLLVSKTEIMVAIFVTSSACCSCFAVEFSTQLKDGTKTSQMSRLFFVKVHRVLWQLNQYEHLFAMLKGWSNLFFMFISGGH